MQKKNSIPHLIINTGKRDFENKLINELKICKISLICLAGYMKILSKKFLEKFGKKIINIHPSLLPKFKGLNTFLKVLETKEIKTGCTVHYVNEKLDSGKIIVKKSFYIEKNDSVESLRLKNAEFGI